MKNINILDTLTNEEKNRFITKKVMKDELVFRENQRCEYIAIVIEGTIHIISYTYNGNEIVYNRLTKGMMFGNNLIFSSNPQYRGDVIAKTDGKLLLLKKDELLSLLQKNSTFLERYLEIQSTKGKELNLKLKLLAFDSAEERFLYYLGINLNRIKYKSITNLSQELHLKRETLSRLISRLNREGKINHLKNKTIVLVK